MAINNKYDFLMIFDCENGNPNGDPDSGNTPRVDPESQHGYITDVCLKRKIRNYVELVLEGEPGYNILVKGDRALNTKYTEAYEQEGLKTGQKGKNQDDVNTARDYMCKNYFDVRTFGAVMATGSDPAGKVTGSVQISFARSVSPVFVQDVTITRQARTKEESRETGDTEIGHKYVIPYALYQAEGHISAAFANKLKNGLTEEDLEVLWSAIINMFENDRSAARGKMCMRKLIVFKHDSILGNCPSHILMDKIKIEENNDVPRRFSDYTITIDKDMPDGVELIEKL